MKTAVIHDLAQHSQSLLAWLKAGETVLLMEEGKLLARILPESNSARRELFSERFAPLKDVPDRDLSDIVSENRGER